FIEVPIGDTKTNTLMPIIRQKIVPDSVVYTNCYRSNNALDISDFHHHRINHSTHFAERKHNHINGIENFWNQAKRVLRKYNGIPQKNFPLFLKECESR
ncbi:MAG: IS1595 family transposase, partial [Phototrophicales bacterium]